MLTAIWAIIIFCVLVFVHELGHFTVAKISGVTVHEFSIGMGPLLFKFKKNETVYSLRLFPVGGFVKLEGEDEQSESEGALCKKNAFTRFSVMAAGSIMNIFLGFLIYIVLISSSDYYATNVVNVISENSAFSQAGIIEGDKIIRIEGENYSSNIRNFNDISYFNHKNKGKAATFTILRKGAEYKKHIEPKYNEELGREVFGFAPAPLKKNLFSVINAAFWQCVYVLKIVAVSIGALISGEVPLSSMAGPVGIVSEIGAAAKLGVLTVLSLAAMISINLGFVNLLPIPALDGGRILFVIIEKIRRKPISPDREGLVHLIGFVLLISLIIIVSFSDIKRIFGL